MQASENRPTANTGLGLALAIAIVKWALLWRVLPFPSSSNWPTQSATVEQVLVHSYSGRAGTTYRAETSYSYQTHVDYYAGYYMGDLLVGSRG